MGTNTNTCGCRKKPVSGNTGTGDEMEEVTAVAVEDEICFGMIWPHHGMCRGRT
ncbi:hypothetical protein [Hydrogenophaga sp.]|uniref:hypothetical protein n=1 Tax=Hydrogenophaga sp. TaxID=1904254 RepID=UPI00273442D5|nr:hypothetical protein [Hydrogenophaga sp.]